ncbi:MAG: hypothetical protein AAF383_25785, partial [Cyanobacteria bacterium P01_A01_bin.83]
RYFDNREHRFDITLPKDNDPILAVCPQCNSKALVLPNTKDTVKCVCTKCSFNKTKSNKSRSLGWHMDIPHDGYFGFDLWLQTYCCGHSLYAFTIRHLELLEKYIQADLRERRPSENGWWCNSSVVAKLPKWIKSHKNREQLLKAIEKLRAKL